MNKKVRSDKLNTTAMVIMAKEPKVGSTKTRLCPPLSLAEAAALYEALLLDTIQLGTELEGIDLAVAVTPPESTDYFERVTPPGTLLLPVACWDIGDCLTQVLGRLLEMGYEKAFALNSDGPSLPEDYIFQAVQLLDDHDLVLGPGEDGGYYLIGLKEPQEEIFKHIDWSTSRVFSQTLTRTEVLELKVALTPPWYDVDTAEEIKRLKAELNSLSNDRLPHTRRFLDNFTTDGHLE
jgi:rSAM/selenodomain-associated transferase 1